MKCAWAHRAGALSLTMRGTLEDDSTAKPTEIAILKAGKRLQTLTVESDGVLLDGLGIEAIDLDFDGYDDLKVLTLSSAGPNGGYAFWLYRPAKGAFERRQDLDDPLSGFDVNLDPKTKTISQSGRNGCCAWSGDSYRWANDRLLHISDRNSGALDLGDALADVAGIQAFIETSASFCATQTRQYDAAGGITQEVIETEGDPCEDEGDYRKRGKAVDKTLNGTKRHGNVTDLYRDGILLQRTIVYDPPKQP
jgi:hypothetical protein